ncbi:hypothetical protein RND81_13G070600, partial [Saponaria officinalis]
RLVINYKPLNKALKWIRYPIQNKRDLLNRLYDSIIFSKFDLKSESIDMHFKHLDTFKKIIINSGLFISKPKIITDKTQLQRFLGSLNYIAPYYKNVANDKAILYERLKKNPQPLNEKHSNAVKIIKNKVIYLPCLALANPHWDKIIETDASDIGYGGILKQIDPNNKQEFLVRFYSG